MKHLEQTIEHSVRRLVVETLQHRAISRERSRRRSRERDANRGQLKSHWPRAAEVRSNGKYPPALGPASLGRQPRTPPPAMPSSPCGVGGAGMYKGGGGAKAAARAAPGRRNRQKASCMIKTGSALNNFHERLKDFAGRSANTIARTRKTSERHTGGSSMESIRESGRQASMAPGLASPVAEEPSGTRGFSEISEASKPPDALPSRPSAAARSAMRGSSATDATRRPSLDLQLGSGRSGSALAQAEQAAAEQV